MFKKLKEIFFGKPPLEMNHNFFGKILFMGGDIPEEDDYWESELEIEGCKEPITVIIVANSGGPTLNQVEFYKQITSNLDELFNRCWPIFEPDFEQWTGKKFSGKWRNEFELEGICIPKDGDGTKNWDVSYYADLAKHSFTAYFEDGKPKYNTIDG